MNQEKQEKPQRRPLMRFHATEQITTEYYLIPRDQVEKLLREAIQELYGDIADMDASVASSLEILEYIDAALH